MINIEELKRNLSQDNIQVLVIDHHEQLNGREHIFIESEFTDNITDRFRDSLDSSMIVFYKGYRNMTDITNLYVQLEDLLNNVDSLDYLNQFGYEVDLPNTLRSISMQLQDKLTDIVKKYGDFIEDLDQLQDILDKIKS